MTKQQAPLTFGEVFTLLQTMHKDRDEYVALMEDNKAKMNNIIKDVTKQIKDVDAKLWDVGCVVGRYLERTNTTTGKRGFAHQFCKLGYDITKVSKNVTLYHEEKKALREIDVLLEGNKTAILIEIKTHLKVADVRSHMKRLETYRLYANKQKDTKTFYAAVAGAILVGDVEKFVHENKLYLFRYSGQFFDIIPPPEGFDNFTPKTW